MEEENKTKTRREIKLTIQQQVLISVALGKCYLDNRNVTEMGWYKKKNEIDHTGVFFQSGTTKTNNFQKSSRFVFVSHENRYGEIVSILEHNENDSVNTWFQVNLYLNEETDEETLLPFARIDGLRRVCIVSAERLSNPLIVSIDNNIIWFISIKHSSEFSWLHDHVNCSH